MGGGQNSGRSNVFFSEGGSCNNRCSLNHQPRNHPHHHFCQLTRTMVWVLPETLTMVWVSFSLQIYSTFEFWRFKFSVVWVFVWVPSILWGWGWFPHRQLKTDVAIATEVSISSKNSLIITADLLAKKMQLVNYCENPLPATPPHSRLRSSQRRLHT